MRHIIGALAAAGFESAAVGAPGRNSTRPFAPAGGPRSRLLFVNDLSGDIDGLFAGVHALLSPSIDLCAIVGTAAAGRRESSEASVALAEDMLRLTGRTVPVHPGATTRIGGDGKPIDSPGSRAIIAAALRSDGDLPLYLAVGGGLTEVASAIMMEPAIAARMTLIWIGGPDWPGGGPGEYNFNLDRRAAQYLFNESVVPLWLVPRDVYATCVVSASELEVQLAAAGAAGAWLYDRLLGANKAFAGLGMNSGETWTLGDSPLVLLTALTDWVPSVGGKRARYENSGSSRFEMVPRPRLDRGGLYLPVADKPPIRVYRTVDTRLMFADLFAKLRRHADGPVTPAR